MARTGELQARRDAQPLADEKPVDVRLDMTRAQRTPPSPSPYFSRPNIEQSYYDISDQRYLNRPLSPYPLAAWAEFRVLRSAGAQWAEVVQSIKRVNGFGVVSRAIGGWSSHVCKHLIRARESCRLSGKDFLVTTSDAQQREEVSERHRQAGFALRAGKAVRQQPNSSARRTATNNS